MTMMGWYGDGMGGGGWLVMILVMLAFWVLVVVAVLALFRGTGEGGPPNRSARRDPMEILEERFARGEIDAEEFRVRQEALRDVVR